MANNMLFSCPLAAMLLVLAHCHLPTTVLGGEPVASNGTASRAAEATRSLAERLGHRATDRLLIIHGDDAGMCHAANAATLDALEHGLLTSASIMVPCPWFPEIAEYARCHPQADFGIHLTHTSEWPHYRWGPITCRHLSPGLVAGDGCFHATVPEVYKHTNPGEIEREARAQIEKALAAKIDVTHLDSHMGVLMQDERYFEVYHRLACEYELPIRMANKELIPAAASQRHRLAKDGILCPDHLIHGGHRPGESTADYWKRMLRSLKPGVTELFIHASLPAEELKHITQDHRWKQRGEEHRLFTRDPEVQKIIREEKIHLIGYRELRDLQRKEGRAQRSTAHAFRPDVPDESARPSTPAAGSLSSSTRLTKRYSMRLPAPPEKVFPLLCPVREHEWIDYWACEMVYSESGIAENNCVFKTSLPGRGDMIWTVSRYEPPRRIEFVILKPDSHVWRLDIHLEPANDNATRAAWTHTFTAVSEHGNEYVDSYTDARHREHLSRLEQALVHFLETGKMKTHDSVPSRR